MNEEFNLVLNITIAKGLVTSLTNLNLPNTKIESITEAIGEDASRFGLEEVVTVLVIIKGTMEVIKLGLEIRNLLKREMKETGNANQIAILSSPLGSKSLEIKPQESDPEIEERVARTFPTTQ